MLYTACLILPYAAIFFAAQSNSALNVALLTQSEVIFAALIGWLFLKEQLQASRLAGVAFILLSNLIVLYSGGLSFNLMSLILIFAPFVFVFGNAIAKRLQAEGLPYAPLLLFRGVVGGIFTLGLSFLIEEMQMPVLSSWSFLLFFGLFCFGIPKVFWQIALNKIDLSKNTAIALSYPAFSFILAYFWLGEIPSFYQWAGLLFSFVGIYFLMRSSSRSLLELASRPD
ncbi:EamA family transporter [Candidatus Peregrinibacteria bacterium]|nr:MAG: EamA family transporter [Candidatus Peregrinibacteria bacterium]